MLQLWRRRWLGTLIWRILDSLKSSCSVSLEGAPCIQAKALKCSDWKWIFKVSSLSAPSYRCLLCHIMTYCPFSFVQFIASGYSNTEGHRKMPERQQQCSAVADLHVLFDCVNFSS